MRNEVLYVKQASHGSLDSLRWQRMGYSLIKPASYAAKCALGNADFRENYSVRICYYGYRYFNTLTGRWKSRDPIEENGGLNVYGFIRNDGVNRWDILGLRVCRLKSHVGNFRLKRVSVDVDDVADILTPGPDFPKKLIKKTVSKALDDDLTSLAVAQGYTVQIEYDCCECPSGQTTVRWVGYSSSDTSGLDANKFRSTRSEARDAARDALLELIDDAKSDSER